MLPTQILDEFCTANTIPLPSYAEDGTNCVINDEMYTISEFGKLTPGGTFIFLKGL